MTELLNKLNQQDNMEELSVQDIKQATEHFSDKERKDVLNDLEGNFWEDFQNHIDEIYSELSYKLNEGDILTKSEVEQLQLCGYMYQKYNGKKFGYKGEKSKAILVDGIIGPQTRSIISSIKSNRGEEVTEIEQVPKLHKITSNEFDMYFKGEDFQQDLIGNCYLLSTLDSLLNLNDYKELILESVSLISDGDRVLKYIISLPLGSKNSSDYEVTPSNFISQVGIDGMKKNLINTEINGLTAIVHALGQSMTGKREFDFEKLSGGHGVEVVQHLLDGYKTYFNAYNNGSGLRKIVKDIGGYKSKLDTVLKKFDGGKHLLTVSVDQTGEYDEINQIGFFGSSNHEVSIEKINTDESGDIVSVIVSNPRDSSKTYPLIYPDCLSYFNSYCLASKEDISGIGGASTGPSSFAKFLGEVISGSENDTMNLLIENTGSINDDERLGRGNVIITEISPYMLNVKGWGADSQISINEEKLYNEKKISIEKRYRQYFDENYGEELTEDEDDLLEYNINDQISKLTFPGGNQDYKIIVSGNEINFGKDPGFMGNQMDIFYNYLPRISVLLGKISNNYINNESGDGSNPFKLGKNGDLLFDDDLNKNEGSDYYKRKAKEMLGDDYVTILSDRSVVGIKNNSKEQEIIVDYLNGIYGV